MNGKDLLEAMSHVAECYVDEAEYKRPRKQLPMGWLSAAACLCILIAGAAFWLRPAYGNDCAMPEGNGCADMQMQETMAVAENPVYGTPEMDGRVPFVVLYVDTWNENGFTATAQKEGWRIAPGTEVTVMIEEDILVYLNGAEEERIPTEVDFPVGSVVTVAFNDLREEDGKFIITATIIWDWELEGES